jgi:hypothetical protein
MKYKNKSKLQGEELKRLLVTLKSLPSNVKSTITNNVHVKVKRDANETIFIITDR